jgi:hypothetical protein
VCLRHVRSWSRLYYLPSPHPFIYPYLVHRHVTQVTLSSCQVFLLYSYTDVVLLSRHYLCDREGVLPRRAWGAYFFEDVRFTTIVCLFIYEASHTRHRKFGVLATHVCGQWDAREGLCFMIWAVSLDHLGETHRVAKVRC